MPEALVIPLCSLAYAYRGGRLGQLSGFIGRLAWFAAVGLSVWLCTDNALYGLCSAIGAFLGNLIPHGHYFTMGRVAEPVNRKDWLGDMPDWCAMGIIGLIRGCLIYPISAPLFALAHISAYEIGWRIDKNDGVWISEYVFGAFVGLIIYVV